MSEGIVSGITTGTAAALSVACGFVPARIDLQIAESGLIGHWDDSMRAGTLCIEHISELRTDDILIGVHLPLIGSTDTQLANNRCTTQFNGAGDVREECTAAAAGTAFAATDDDIDADEWACYQLCAASGSSLTIVRSGATWGAVGGYASEALAIAAMATKTGSSASLGYITIQATASAIFNATTDALAGGSTGTAAAATNYYAGYGVMSNGITVKGNAEDDTYHGFEIGTSALLNIANSVIHYKAYRS